MSDLVIVKAKVTPKLKLESSKALDNLGLDVSTAIRMMLLYVVRTGQLPMMDQPFIIVAPKGSAEDLKDLIRSVKGKNTLIVEPQINEETHEKANPTPNIGNGHPDRLSDVPE
jgi:addiction module RelB/DinJ family antitoxin